MPRYFFHTIDGETITDDEGTVLAGLDEARAQAIVFSGEMLRGSRGQVLGMGNGKYASPMKPGTRYARSRFRLTGLSSLTHVIAPAEPALYGRDIQIFSGRDPLATIVALDPESGAARIRPAS
jgi:hypothetical protein